MASKMKTEFVQNFAQLLAEEGDMFFPIDGDKQDMEMIQSRIAQQGYWAGNSLRYFFDMDLLSKGTVKLLKTEERSFG